MKGVGRSPGLRCLLPAADLSTNRRSGAMAGRFAGSARHRRQRWLIACLSGSTQRFIALSRIGHAKTGLPYWKYQIGMTILRPRYERKENVVNWRDHFGVMPFAMGDAGVEPLGGGHGVRRWRSASAAGGMPCERDCDADVAACRRIETPIGDLFARGLRGRPHRPEPVAGLATTWSVDSEMLRCRPPSCQDTSTSISLSPTGEPDGARSGRD